MAGFFDTPVLEVTMVANNGAELNAKAAQCYKLLHRLCLAISFGVSHQQSSVHVVCAWHLIRWSIDLLSSMIKWYDIV